MDNIASTVAGILIGSRRPPAGTEELHADILVALEDVAKGTATNADVDTLLAKCPTDECSLCGVMCCPHNEPLHFHHDGCPACDGGCHEEQQS